MSRTRRFLGAVAALAVGTALTAAVTTSVAAAPARPVREASAASTTNRTAAAFPTRPTKVLVLGDSVMAGANDQYAGALPGREVVADAVVNRTTGQGADVVAQRGTDWDVVVVLLAHNDGASPGVYQPAANRILDQLAGVPRVVWLTLHEVRPYYAGVNQFLRDQAANRPNLRVADWNALVNQNPGAVAGDGLHLSPSGRSLMAGFVAEQVQVAEVEFAPPPPTTTTAPPTTLPPPTTTTTATTSTTTTTAPPSTTSTTEPAATLTATADGQADDDGSDPADEAAADEEIPADTPAAVWPLLGLGTVAMAATLRHHRRAGRLGPSPQT